MKYGGVIDTEDYTITSEITVRKNKIQEELQKYSRGFGKRGLMWGNCNLLDIIDNKQNPLDIKDYMHDEWVSAYRNKDENPNFDSSVLIRIKRKGSYYTLTIGTRLQAKELNSSEASKENGKDNSGSSDSRNIISKWMPGYNPT